MTVGGIVAIGFLLVVVAFVVRGIRRHGDGSDSSNPPRDGGAAD